MIMMMMTMIAMLRKPNLKAYFDMFCCWCSNFGCRKKTSASREGHWKPMMASFSFIWLLGEVYFIPRMLTVHVIDWLCYCYSCFSVYHTNVVQLARRSVCCFSLMQVISCRAESMVCERSVTKLYKDRVTAQQSHWVAYWKLAVWGWCSGFTQACCMYYHSASVTICNRSNWICQLKSRLILVLIRPLSHITMMRVVHNRSQESTVKHRGNLFTTIYNKNWIRLKRNTTGT